jgi:hypothetical protein
MDLGHILANDKIMVIVAVTIIAVVALCILTDASAKEICLTCIGALGGLTVGQVFKRDCSPDEKKDG